MNSAIRFLLLTGGLAIFAQSMPAVCLEPHPKPNAEFFKSNFVFVGTVLSARAELDVDGFLAATDYSVRVEKIYRGPHRTRLTTYSENSSGRFPLDVGQRYLLFAYRDEEGHLTISNCGNSGLASDAEATIHAITLIPKAGPYADIEGRIVTESNAEVSGLKVIARSRRRTFATTSDGDGWFHLRVPPGKYSVETKSDKFYTNAYDLSYDDPYGFVVPRGGCAEIQLIVHWK
jgi:hypothetical protein